MTITPTPAEDLAPGMRIRGQAETTIERTAKLGDSIMVYLSDGTTNTYDTEATVDVVLDSPLRYDRWPTAPIIRILRGEMPPCGDLRGRIAYRETPEAGYYVPELDVGLWQSNLDLQLEEWEEMVAVPKRIVDELRRRVAAHDDGYRRHEPVDGLYGLKDKIVSTARGVVRQADAGGEATE